MKSFLKEFREFALRGNVADMAVGIIIGAAFGKIVSSLVNDIIMPPLGWIIGGVDFTDLRITISDAVGDKPAVFWNYGQFIQVTVDFIIVALAIFVLIRAMNSIKRKEALDPTPAPPPKPTKDQELLTEIRDLLRKAN